jgi:hypothetical protein
MIGVTMVVVMVPGTAVARPLTAVAVVVFVCP